MTLGPQYQISTDRFQRRMEHLMSEIHPDASPSRASRFRVRLIPAATAAALLIGGACVAQAHNNPRTDDTQLKGGAINCTATPCVQQAANDAKAALVGPDQARLTGTEMTYYYDDFGNAWADFAYGSATQDPGRITFMENRGTRRAVPQPPRNSARAVTVRGTTGTLALWEADPAHNKRPGGWVVWSAGGWTYKLTLETKPGDNTAPDQITKAVIAEANALVMYQPAR